MKIRAREIKAGQIIRFEYGDYENYVKGTVISIEEKERFMEVQMCTCGTDFCAHFGKNELVEVIA